MADFEIYEDEACTKLVTHIDWGTIVPDIVFRKTFYIKNVMPTEQDVILTTIDSINWNPSHAANYVTAEWLYLKYVMHRGQVMPIDVTVQVSSDVIYASPPITEFYYETKINSQWFSGDVDKNGEVDIFDAIKVANALDSTVGQPNWNPDCDFNKDNWVNIFDAVKLAMCFGLKGYKYLPTSRLPFRPTLGRLGVTTIQVPSIGRLQHDVTITTYYR